MNVYEMEGFLRGKCLPGDMKVNERNAQYLVRIFSEMQSQNAELAVQLANAESKCRELESDNEKAMKSLKQADAAVKLAHKKFSALAAENSALKNPDNWLSQSDYGYEASEVATQNGATEDESLRAGMLAIISRIETPATDAHLAEVRASELDSLAGVAETMLVKFSNQRCSQDMHEIVGWKMVLQQASNRAAQLRKGAAL
ncbi:TPA: hypothetical protein QH022_002639 [Citrobacter freundii]|uniref:hypothetical protein n=1 Tax=Citrobacter freundii TaxID=546 RepID=UPI0023509351|nr:hypothetical protein [Citrobacter freundii]HDS4653246.1 hypothetical protein [Citrobacter freundii]HED1393910.1 hypothetical protein [Citrobacter freundii]